MPQDEDSAPRTKSKAKTGAHTHARTHTRTHAKTGKFSVLQASWKLICPWLVCTLMASSIGTDTVCFDCNGVGCAECSRLYCSACQLAGKENALTRGSAIFKKETVFCHMVRFHKGWEVRSGQVQDGFIQQMRDEKDRVIGIIRAVHWLAIEKMPLSKTASLSALLRKFGVALGISYLNRKAATQFVHSMAEVLRRKTAAGCKGTWYGIAVDEATDISVKQNLIVYLRVLIEGRYTTRFYRLVEIEAPEPDGQGELSKAAERLLTYIQSALEDDGISLSNLASLAADGASVMSGPKEGLAVRLRRAFNPFMLSAHCVAHRHQLAVSQAANNTPLADWFDQALRDILNYFADRLCVRLHLQKSKRHWDWMFCVC